MATRTFLFVDQVGSTEQLTRLGDVAAQSVRRALFDTLRSATAVAGGHEVDFTGDGLFCAFDGAADAVDAAVAMQQLVVSFNGRREADQHLGIRVGLHTGEPLESEGGGYFGAAVVVAARLCGQAQPGQVLASGLVRALVEPRGTHPFEPVGRLQLKGVPEPVETFSVGWVADSRQAQLPPLLAAQHDGPFAGRRAELAAVVQAWESTAEGGRRLVLVSGDRGMGVSRLLAEAAAVLRGRGASVWAGAGLGGDARLAAWAEAVGTWAAATPRAELRLALGERGSDLSRLVPGLRDLVPGLPAPAAMDPAAEVFLVAEAVDELAARWSGVEPLVVVLDALEEADPATLTVLRRVLGSGRGGRVLVLAGYEPAAVGAPRLLASLRGIDQVTELRLEGLAAEDVERLLTDISGHAVDPATVRGVLAESEGSPYFVVQMARSMQERALTGKIRESVDRAADARTDLRLRREEVTLALRQLEQLRETTPTSDGLRLEPDGTPPAPGDAPYRGLLAFQAEDAEVFFGREQLVAEMVAGLLSSRWLTVVGPSGSGKSSTVRAGLLPALAGGALPDSASWTTAVCTPGPDPLAALGAALAAAGERRELPDTVARLRAGRLGELVDEAVGGRRLVLVVDQFEELWTVAPEADRRRVLELLVEAAEDGSGRILIVVCMRADHYGLAAENAALTALLAESHVLVAPMTTAELRAAIELPARRGGWVLEPGLAQAVVDDVGGEPGGLPLLSTAMLETWHRRRGRSLTLAGYAETGGARRAIATMADAALDELAPDQQDAARRLLLRLGAPTADGGDVARPAPLTELGTDERSRTVLAHLADRRLLIVGATTAQVAHEALLREWPRLRAWLESDREGRRLHQQIATAATDWNSGGRDDGALLRGARLAAALDWRADHDQDLTELEREYLTASAEAQQAELRRARRTTRRFQYLTVGLVLLLIGAAVAGGLAVANSREAAQREQEALARGLSGQAAGLAETDVDTALLLAVEAFSRDPSIESESALLTALDGASALIGPADGLPPDAVDVVTSPDGQRLAVLTASGDLVLHDGADLRALGNPLADGIVNPYYAEFTPDGESVVWSDSTGVHIVHVQRSGEIDELGGGAQAVFSIDASGQVLAIASSLPWPDGDPAGVRLMDLPSRTELVTVPAMGLGLTSIRPGARELLVAVGVEEVQRFGFDGQPIGDPVGGLYSQSLQHSPSGDVFLSFTGEFATLHDADTLAQLGEPMVPSGGFFYDAAFSPEGDYLYLTSDDGALSRYTVDGRLLDRISGYGGTAAVTLLRDGRVLAAAPNASAVYDFGRLTALGDAVDAPEPFGHLAVGPDDTVMTMQGDALVTVGPGTASDPTAVENLGLQSTAALAVSPDGDRVAVLDVDGQGPPRVLIAERRTGELLVDVSLQVRAEAAFGIGRLAFSPDGDRLAVGAPDGSVAVLASSSGATLARVELDTQRADALLWSPDGAVLHQGGFEGVLRRLDPATLEAVGEGLPLTGPISDIVALPGAGELAVATRTGDVHFVDVRTWQANRDPIRSGGTDLNGLAVSPDGGRLAAISADGALRLWRLSDGRAVGPPVEGHGTIAIGIAWPTPDRLVTTGYSLSHTQLGNLISWEMGPRAWSERACAIAGRSLTRDEWQRYLPEQEYRRTCTGD